MPLFLVTPLGHNYDQIGLAVRKAFAESGDWFEVQSRAGYLVNYRGTSVELSHLLKITSEDPQATDLVGPALITSVGSYYGRAATTMWEWMKSRLEAR